MLTFQEQLQMASCLTSIRAQKRAQVRVVRETMQKIEPTSFILSHLADCLTSTSARAKVLNEVDEWFNKERDLQLLEMEVEHLHELEDEYICSGRVSSKHRLMGKKEYPYDKNFIVVDRCEDYLRIVLITPRVKPDQSKSKAKWERSGKAARHLANRC